MAAFNPDAVPGYQDLLKREITGFDPVEVASVFKKLVPKPVEGCDGIDKKAARYKTMSELVRTAEPESILRALEFSQQYVEKYQDADGQAAIQALKVIGTNHFKSLMSYAYLINAVLRQALGKVAQCHPFVPVVKKYTGGDEDDCRGFLDKVQGIHLRKERHDKPPHEEKDCVVVHEKIKYGVTFLKPYAAYLCIGMKPQYSSRKFNLFMKQSHRAAVSIGEDVISKGEGGGMKIVMDRAGEIRVRGPIAENLPLRIKRVVHIQTSDYHDGYCTDWDDMEESYWDKSTKQWDVTKSGDCW